MRAYSIKTQGNWMFAIELSECGILLLLNNATNWSNVLHKHRRHTRVLIELIVNDDNDRAISRHFIQNVLPIKCAPFRVLGELTCYCYCCCSWDHGVLLVKFVKVMDIVHKHMCSTHLHVPTHNTAADSLTPLHVTLTNGKRAMAQAIRMEKATRMAQTHIHTRAHCEHEHSHIFRYLQNSDVFAAFLLNRRRSTPLCVKPIE